MNDSATTSSLPDGAIPADDPTRRLTIARPDTDPTLRHIGVAGDTYTILLAGQDTGGRYCLLDMHVPPGGGPPPHRHDFEEMFTVLAGEIEVTFRGEKSAVRAGETVSVPSNAPHAFKKVSATTARLLCLCSPAGLEAFFLEVGDLVETRTTPPPTLSREEQTERMKKLEALAPRYRTEMIKP